MVTRFAFFYSIAFKIIRTGGIYLNIEWFVVIISFITITSQPASAIIRFSSWKIRIFYIANLVPFVGSRGLVWPIHLVASWPSFGLMDIFAPEFKTLFVHFLWTYKYLTRNVLLCFGSHKPPVIVLKGALFTTFGSQFDSVMALWNISCLKNSIGIYVKMHEEKKRLKMYNFQQICTKRILEQRPSNILLWQYFVIWIWRKKINLIIDWLIYLILPS